MNIPETFYIALCVTILLLGVIYWFWTQVQYLQRKVNLLDNVVYEMKTLVSNLPPGGGSSADVAPPVKFQTEFQRPSANNDDEEETANIDTPYAPPPESVAGDLEAERLASEIEFENFSGANDASGVNIRVSENYAPPPNDDKRGATDYADAPEVADDLQPGGLAVPASAPPAAKKRSVAPPSDVDPSLESPLSSMSIKDLRRMAEANNIPGANELKKKDLIKALRDKVGTIISNDAEPSEAPLQTLSFDDIDAPNAE
jgi:hypothetical protein